jgi:prepilin signal peptidase PulO-like enzyme (type II secretory pathway)
MHEPIGDTFTALPTFIATIAPLGALIPAVHVDAAELRLPLPWVVAAAAAAVAGAVAVGGAVTGAATNLDAAGGLSAAAVSLPDRLAAAGGVVAVLGLAGRISRPGVSGGLGRGDLRLGAVIGLALGVRFAYLALAASCIAASCMVAVSRVARTPARRVPFGPALVFGYGVALALELTGVAHG